MRLKEDNRGVSLVMVIGIVAIVTILVTIAVSLGLFNYQMKVTNKESKDNFYDAEAVLDEIRLGLQNDVSDALSEAYLETLNHYTDKDLPEAQDYFEDVYIRYLREKWKSGADGKYYDMDYLLGFLEEGVKKNTTLTTSKGRNPVLVTGTEGVILKNLYLTYVNEKDYITRIATDIHIQIPDINFSKFNTASNVVQYAIIAQGGITVQPGTAQINFNGNVYAGSSTSASYDSVTISNGKTVNIADGKDLVVKDTICVKKGGALNQSKGATIWTTDIEMENASKADLAGTSYVANDMTLLGGADVTIGGEYYGFGNPKAALLAESIQDIGLQKQIETTPSDYSSAIIINAIGSGSRAVLNLKDMQAMMLAGNAYIGDSKVLMGESLTVKCNQIAYLVPQSCMMGASNPMTSVKRAEMLAAVPGDTQQDKEVNFKNQILLRVRTEVSGEVEEIVQMVSADGLYYYYMRFSNAKAADSYFDSYYKSGASAKIKDYLKYYVEDEEIKINTAANKVTNGHILVYDETGISSIADSIAEGTKDLSEDEKLVKQLATYQDIFHSLNTNLSMDYTSLTNMQKARDTVYQNLFNTALNWRLAGANGYYAIYDEDTTYVAKYYNGNIISVANEKNKAAQALEDSELKMIIASGDVTIDTDFEGLIICGGRVKIKPKSGMTNVTISSNPTMTSRMIDESVEYFDKKYTLKEFMYNPEYYAGKYFEVTGKDDNSIRLEDLVVYTNWSKE